MAYDPFRGLSPLERYAQHRRDVNRYQDKMIKAQENKKRMAQSVPRSMLSRGDYVQVHIPGNPMHGMLGKIRDIDVYHDVIFVEHSGGKVFACGAAQVRHVSPGAVSAAQNQININAVRGTLNQLGSAPNIVFGSWTNLSTATSSTSTNTNPNGNNTTPMNPPSTLADLTPEAIKRRADGKPQYRDFVPGDEFTDHDGRVYNFKEIRNDRIYFTVTGTIGDTWSDWWYRNDGRPFGRPGSFANSKKKKLSFNDVILPDDKKRAIMDAVRQLDNHKLIFEEWGFGDTLEKGKAVSMLFYGPPGTGKTMIAQAIADEYDLKLQMISTAEIESSEPGQAERNIKAYFDGAKDGKTLLFFDECDSLIADRRDIGMILGAQVNALLTSLENYEGIAVFATNRLEKMDEAFDRRLSLKLEFALPTQADRVKIWRRLFPDKAPIADDIDWEALASVEISGGYIKNVVLQAARRAANSEEKRITHDILVDCLINEVERMTQFQDAIKSNTTPKLRGGGHGISRSITPQATIGQGK